MHNGTGTQQAPNLLPALIRSRAMPGSTWIGPSMVQPEIACPAFGDLYRGRRAQNRLPPSTACSDLLGIFRQGSNQFGSTGPLTASPVRVMSWRCTG